MTADEIRALEKAVSKAKRIATERAGELHDLVEDRLPAGYEEIPGIAQATYDACLAWAQANAALQAAQAETGA
ncbi:CCE_0567 family metalloprotein [Thiocapsa sp.]|uniref:CCE_0567 family metalloprotein n=1 Tax=Thiocapsa sp. TaxID=2024551 RepID=UPI0035934856